MNKSMWQYTNHVRDDIYLVIDMVLKEFGKDATMLLSKNYLSINGNSDKMERFNAYIFDSGDYIQEFIGKVPSQRVGYLKKVAKTSSMSEKAKMHFILAVLTVMDRTMMTLELRDRFYDSLNPGLNHRLAAANLAVFTMEMQKINNTFNFPYEAYIVKDIEYAEAETPGASPLGGKIDG